MDQLDPVIHVQARLRTMAALAALAPDETITFPELQQFLDFTAGNLTTHLRKLEEANYVTVAKTFLGRKPVTHLRLTRQGRRALEDYTAKLEALLNPIVSKP